MGFLKEVALDTTKYTAIRLVSILIGALALPFLARVLLPSEYAVYSTIITSLGYYVLFSTSWLNNSVIRYYEEYRLKSDVVTLMSTALVSNFIINFATSIIVTSVFFLTSLFGLRELIIVIPLLFFKSIISIFNNYYRSRQKVLTTGLTQLFDRFAEFAIGFPILLLGVFSHVTSFYVGMLIGEFAIMFFCVYYAFKNKIFQIKSFDLSVLKIIFIFGFPLLMSNLTSMIGGTLDRYMLLYYHGNQNTGIYTFIADLAGKTVSNIPQLLSFSLLPIFIKYSNKDFDFTIKKISLFYKLFLLGFLPVFILLFYFRYEFFSIFGTADYKIGVPLLPWFFTGYFLNSLSWFLICILLLQKKSKLIFGITLISILVYIIPNIIFLPFADYTFPKYPGLASGIVNFSLTFYFVIKSFNKLKADLWFTIGLFALLTILILGRAFLAQNFGFNDMIWYNNIIASIPIVLVFGFIAYRFVRKNWIYIKS